MNFYKAGRFCAIPGLLALQLLAATGLGLASDLRVPIPGKSISTPSQRLNREGVAELKHGHQNKAKQLFYKAYLLDPDDPFTLNNLGYVAELEGDADRALRYYALASREHTDAVIDKSSSADLRGKPLDEAFRQVQNSDQETSRLNERAIVMLQQGHVLKPGIFCNQPCRAIRRIRFCSTISVMQWRRSEISRAPCEVIP